MKIQIALASDCNYYAGLLVTAASLAKCADESCELVFNILNSGISEAKLDELRRQLLALHARTEMRAFEIDQTDFADFPEWMGSSRMAYARLKLPELLPHEEHVIYCDVDFLWMADVAELWALRDRDHSILACLDTCEWAVAKEAQWYAERGIAVDPSRYINSGLAIMNLRRFRETDCSRRVMDFLRLHPDVQYVDQSAINAVIDDIGLLPAKWGRFARYMHSEELPGDYAIHFAAYNPWKRGRPLDIITDAHAYWYRFYGELVGKGETEARREFIPDGEYAVRRFSWIVAQHASLRALVGAILWPTRYRYVAKFLKQFSRS